MSWFSKKKKEINPLLIGEWHADQNDLVTKNAYGDVKMIFDEDGKLIYKIYSNDKVQIIELTYWIKDDILFSDQPSAPKVEQTKFSFKSPDILFLEYQGVQGRFLKSF